MKPQKPSPIYRKIIARPEDYEPSHPDLTIVGTFNAPLTIIKDNGLEKILVMMRVAEEHKKTKDGKIYLPYFEIPNEEGYLPKIGFDEYQRRKLKKIGKKEVKLEDGTDRLRHISLPRKMFLDLEGNVIERQQNPAIYPTWESERFGTEDLRITLMEDGRYILTYVCPHREEGVSTAILSTLDFRTYERILKGNTSRPILVNEKDIAIFPEKIESPFGTEAIKKGQKIYAGLTRPNGSNISSSGIWVSYSPDLVCWGMHHRLTKDKETTGTGSPPIKYKDKWIAAYHKTFKITGKKNPRYTTRLFRVDAKEPWKGFKTSGDFLTREDYKDILPEEGYVEPVVYTIGMIEHEGETIFSSGIGDKWDVIDSFYTEDVDKFIERS